MGDIGVVQDPAAATAPWIDPTTSTVQEVITVLVTGFGPFKSNPVNASHLIATSLPSSITIPPRGPVRVGDNAVSAPREIRIHAHPSPIRVSYAGVRTELPAIVQEYAQSHNGNRPDLIMHIGIASTRKFYSVETQAHRDNYRITDVDGKLGYEDGEKMWKDKGLPAVLKPGPADTPQQDGKSTSTLLAAPALSVETNKRPLVIPYPADGHFLQTWKSYAPPGTDIRLSEDAGRYLCEFIFYSSLSQALEEGRDRSVLFFHVPSGTDDKTLDNGLKAAVALIKAMVTCWIDEAKQNT